MTYNPRSVFQAYKQYGEVKKKQAQTAASGNKGLGSPVGGGRGNVVEKAGERVASFNSSRGDRKDRRDRNVSKPSIDERIWSTAAKWFGLTGGKDTEPEPATPVRSKLYERPEFNIPAPVEVTTSTLPEMLPSMAANFGTSMGIDPYDPRGRDQRALPQNTYQSTINTVFTGGGRDEPVRGRFTTPTGLMSPPTMGQPAAPEGLTGIPRGLAIANALPTAKYKIQSGDTLSEIAKATGSSVEELASINGISNVDVIQAGKDLEIPIRRIEDESVVTKAKSMEELKPIKASFTVEEPSLQIDTTDPDAEFYSSFTQGITPSEMMQTTGDDEYVSADYMSELEILARTIEAEAAGESKEGKLAVGAVIANRADSTKYGMDIRGVILKKAQFSPWNAITGYQKGISQAKPMLTAEMKPSKDSYEAAKEILSGDYVDPTDGATHYLNPKVGKKPKWYNKFKERERGTIKIGRHEFGNADSNKKYDGKDWINTRMQESIRPKRRPLGRP